MWGTRVRRVFNQFLVRFIPTHVGNSFPGIWTPCAWFGSSPRMWGTPSTRAPLSARDGSSPRMWGTRRDNHECGDCIRFIPTHVGNSRERVYSTASVPVHPHACGELARSRAMFGPGAGSSPRMWGTLVRAGDDAGIARFIPTHVGNSFHSHDHGAFAPVHPHACGELSLDSSRQPTRTGSSPRMWGTLAEYIRRGRC